AAADDGGVVAARTPAPWLRSAASWVFASVNVGCGEVGAAPVSSAIARSIFRRCPSETPSSLTSSSVRSRRTEVSMSLSTKRSAYSDTPSALSQSAICCIAAPYGLKRHPFWTDRTKGLRHAPTHCVIVKQRTLLCAEE